MKPDLGGMIHRSVFCARLGISTRTARRWAALGYGPPPRRIGGSVYYVEAEIGAFLMAIGSTGASVVA